MRELGTNEKIMVLEGALDALGPNGENWKKNSYGREGSGSWCLAGACAKAAIRLNLVGDDSNPDFYFFCVLADALTRATSLDSLAKDDGFEDVPSFNDSSGTTFQDIRAFVQRRLAQLGR